MESLADALVGGAQAEQEQEQESRENQATHNVDPIARLRVAQRSEAHVRRRQALQHAPLVRKQLEAWTLDGIQTQVGAVPGWVDGGDTSLHDKARHTLPRAELIPSQV